MKQYQRLFALVALVLLVGGTFWTINAQTNAGRDIWLPFVNGGSANLATALPLPTVNTGPPTLTPAATPPPGSTATPVPAKPVVPPADAASAKLSVPVGFAVRIYATLGASATPRLMTIGPDGALYVAERGANQVVRLQDANNDGLAEAAVPVVTGLNGPHSVEWYNGALYIAENDKVSKWANGTKTTIVALPTGGNHTSRTAHIGPDGFLYVSAGSTCNTCNETDKRRATIMRYTLDGKIPSDNPFATDSDPNRRPVWAEGLRNSIDFLWTPAGQLWANMNSSDNVGENTSDNVPPEPAVINVEKGKHYGWPFCYTPTLGAVAAGTKEVRDTKNNVEFAAPISSCDQPTPALFTDAAHQAPIGMTQYTKAQFPATYRNGIFEGYHGSWNTNEPANYRDCKVQFVQVQNNRPVASQTFLNGFRAANQKCGDDGTYGRPAGVAVGPNGELFVSDDRNGNIYRIVYTGS